MTSSPTPAVLPDARALIEDMRAAITYQTMPMSARMLLNRAVAVLSITLPASDAAVPAGLWRPFVHQRDVPTDGIWFVARSTKPGYAATRVVRYARKTDRLPTDDTGAMWPSEPTEWMPLDEFAALAAFKVASEGAGLQEALRAAKEEIAWWAEEHGCCAGHETEVVDKIDAALAANATGEATNGEENKTNGQ